MNEREQNLDRQTDMHAYLIMCHTNFRQLCLLLDLLDDARNDIYIHIDKKAKGYSTEQIKSHVRSAKLTFVRPLSVTWGGYSQIKAELRLLKEATKTVHQYYHFLSGMDLPLKTQDEIHRFFDEYNGTDFVALERDHPHNLSQSFTDRVNYYHVFQDHIGRSSAGHFSRLRSKQEKFIELQKSKNVGRLKKYHFDYCKGSNWFSITHDTACYVLNQCEKYKRLLRFTYCADEIFLQTILVNSPCIDHVEDDNLRMIDWSRKGIESFSPYTFREEDFDSLIHADDRKLFARKFDENVDKVIIDKIYSYLQS